MTDIALLLALLEQSAKNIWIFPRMFCRTLPTENIFIFHPFSVKIVHLFGTNNLFGADVFYMCVIHVVRQGFIVSFIVDSFLLYFIVI